MNRLEAIYAMLEGKKIATKSSYMYFDGNKFMNKSSDADFEVDQNLVPFDGYHLFEDKVEWYRVSGLEKKDSRACTLDNLCKSKEDFLEHMNMDESDFHWIKLELVHTEEG